MIKRFRDRKIEFDVESLMASISVSGFTPQTLLILP